MNSACSVERRDVLSQQDIKGRVSDLLTFFRETYGTNYLGDTHFSAQYLSRAERIVALGGLENLLAAALIRRGRVTAAAAASQERCAMIGATRRQVMAEVLGDVRRFDPDSWLTIADQATNVQKAAALAGMVVLRDAEDVSHKLEVFGELDLHVVQPDEDGCLMVAHIASMHGEPYRQYAWGWPNED